MFIDGVSVVVAVFNSADTISELVDRISQVLTNEHQTFEIILVDDGSRDESWKQIVAVAEIKPSIVPIRLTRNFGQHNALLCGLRKLDSRQPSRSMSTFSIRQRRYLGLKQLSEADVVYGAPTRQQQDFCATGVDHDQDCPDGGMGAENARPSAPSGHFVLAPDGLKASALPMSRSTSCCMGYIPLHLHRSRH